MAIARALVDNRAVLLADEPTGAVDTAAGRAIGQLLLDLNAAGQTLLIVTHNPELAERICGRVIQLADGRVHDDTGTAVSTEQPGLAAQPEARHRAAGRCGKRPGRPVGWCSRWWCSRCWRSPARRC